MVISRRDIKRRQMESERRRKKLQRRLYWGVGLLALGGMSAVAFWPEPHPTQMEMPRHCVEFKVNPDTYKEECVRWQLGEKPSSSGAPTGGKQ